MTVSFKVKRTGTKWKNVIEGLDALDRVGTIYVENPSRNARKVKMMAKRGHDPLGFPKQYLRRMKYRISRAIMMGGRQRVMKVLQIETKNAWQFLRQRIATRKLGKLRMSTIESKISASARGKADRRFGVPGPYGFFTGELFDSIKYTVRRKKGRARRGR